MSVISIHDFFYFKTTDKQCNLTLLLTKNDEINSQKVNITALSISRLSTCSHVFNVYARIGGNDYEETEKMKKQFIINLKKLKIDFKIVKGLVINNSNIYTISYNQEYTRKLFALMACNKIKLNAFFESSIIVNNLINSEINIVSNKNEKLLNLINNFNFETGDDNLCINPKNIKNLICNKQCKCNK
jgi:hypothetical protein